MLKYTNENGEIIGYSAKVSYIKKANNGCFITTETADDADGIVFNGNPYNIGGMEEKIPGAPFATLSECDYYNEFLISKVDIDDINNALIELAEIIGG